MQAMEKLSQSNEAREARAGWQFWIDRGGTFTDVIGLSPGGALHVRKVPSLPVADGEDPGLTAAAAILATAGEPGARIEMVKVGTTVATNALLTHTGTPVVLLTTEGFADGLRKARGLLRQVDDLSGRQQSAPRHAASAHWCHSGR